MKKRILFCMLAEKGHINPYIGLAQHLQKRGHTLAFHAPYDISPQLGAAGLFNFIGPKGFTSDENRGIALARIVENKSELRHWIKKLLIENTASAVPSYLKIIKEFQPDIIVSDPMLYSAGISAELTRIPWASISNSLNPVITEDIDSDLLQTVNAISNERDEIFHSFGIAIKFKGCDMLSPYLTTAFTTEALVGRPKEKIALVGPSMPLFARGDESPWRKSEKFNQNPIVYMSLGSQIFYQPHIFKKVFEALEFERIHLVAAVNDLLFSDLVSPLPSNVSVLHYAPQLTILEHAAAMISHGGANSVMEAIKFNVPMMISPICNDAFHQAHFVVKKGIGLEIDLNTACTEAIKKMLRRLLTDNEIRRQMAIVSKSYQIDGAYRAAILVEQLGNEN